ncbi:MAG: glycosyltransferase family 4 protein [Candidatus Levyibacteriota bacterium]
MKKILISLTYYSPHISGLTLSIEHLAEALANDGYAITILTTQHHKQLRRTEVINNVHVIRVPFLFRLSKGFFMPSFLNKAIHALQKTEDVMIVQPQVEGLLLAVLAKMMGKKIHCLYICEVHLSGGMDTQIVAYVLRLINSVTLLFADSVSTLTDDFAKHNAVLQQFAKDVTGIFPIVEFPRIDQTVRQTLNNRLPKADYYLGYLGRISAEKGIHYLLEAIPLLQKELGERFVIVLAGPQKVVGETAYRQQIEKLLQMYSQNVFLLGELPDTSLGAFYSMLDVFVLPSTNNTEAFGMVQVEAMSCGTPVVATDLPGVRVPIKETGMGEIVPPANTQALANAITQIVKKKKEYVKPQTLITSTFLPAKTVQAYKTIFAK